MLWTKAHAGFAMLTFALFAVRGVLMMLDSKLLQNKIVRILPHIVDTCLLATAIYLTTLIGQYPFTADWLTVKLLGLIAYIVLGTIALRRGKTKTIRIAAFGASLLVLGYIFAVAHSRVPWPFGA